MVEETTVTVDAREIQAKQLSTCEAALALARKEKLQAVRLITTLSRDRDPVVRIRAAQCLTEIGGERAVMELMDLLNDPHSQVRITAVGALGAMRAYESRAKLGNVLKADQEINVRIDAARALGKLNDTSGLVLIVRLLEDENEHYRRSAAMALKDIIGQTFPPTQEGIKSARRYLEMNIKKYFSGGS